MMTFLWLSGAIVGGLVVLGGLAFWFFVLALACADGLDGLMRRRKEAVTRG